jgi:hypothetical protein
VDEPVVSANLHAVVPLDEIITVGETVLYYTTLAVGAEGTVVLRGNYERGPDHHEAWTVSDVDLRAVTVATTQAGTQWWVVGDGGFAAVSYDYGESWTPSDLGTTADLHAALTAVGEIQGVVVVGDEAVRVHRDTWLEPPTPDGGWGQLRGLAQLADPESRIFAVGLGGVIWSTDDPAGAWTAEDSGVDVDLLAVGLLGYDEELVAVGAGGTVLLREQDGWRAIESETTVDFIDCAGVGHFGVLLTAQGDVLEFPGFAPVERVEGTLDLGSDGYGLLAVGESGAGWNKLYQQLECY